MDNLWRDEEAQQFEHSDLAMRVYTSRLLGRSDDLVLHGGRQYFRKVLSDQYFW